MRLPALVLGLAAWSAPLWAAHPLITEDAGTQGRGGVQLEVNVERQSEGGLHPTLWGGTLSYGLAEHLDLQLGFPYQVGLGQGDLAVDFKWNFWQRDELGLTFKPGITLPTGRVDHGIGSGRPTAGALLIFNYEPETWLFYTHAGYRHHQNTVDEPTSQKHLSAAVGVKPLARLKLIADLGYDRIGDTTLRQYVLGVIYGITKDFDVDVGVRRGNTAAVDRAVMAGITIRW